MAFVCNECKKTFAHEKSLNRHAKAIHGERSFACNRCGKTFNRKDALNRHTKKHSQDKRHECQWCTKAFYRKDKLDEHEQACKYMQQQKEEDNKRKESEDNDERQIKRQKVDDNQTQQNEKPDDPCEVKSALRDTLKTFRYNPRKNEKLDLRSTLQGKRTVLRKQLYKQLKLKKGIKWFVCAKVKFTKPKVDGEDITSEPHFRSLCMTSVSDHNIEDQINEVNQKIANTVMTYQREGSGWQLSEVLHLDLNVAQYKPIKGSSYLPLPNKLRNRKAVINIKNSDNKCFMWSVLASLHPVPSASNPERIHHYQPFVKELNFDNIQFPVAISKISKFENQNQIAVNVFGFENGVIFPTYISKKQFNTHVNLLLYSQGTTHHYCLIKNLNRFLTSQTKHKGRMYHCPYCLHGFTREKLLQDHQPICSQHNPQRIKLPSDDDMFLQFRDFRKQMRVPFVIYADFESITTKIHSVSANPENSSTENLQKHEACGFAYIVVSERDDYCTPPVVYRGENVVDEFLKMLLKEQERIETLLKYIEPMQLTQEEEDEFQNAVYCHICSEELGEDRVRDHCHLTGEYRGASHNACNLNFQFTGRTPVVLHNLRGYDSHHIMQGLGKIENETINCIPNNMEKYISFSLGKLDFIDSLQFMSASLEKLVFNLAKEGDTKFNTLKRYVDADKLPLLLRKGIYPYDYMDSVIKFQERQLPPKAAFYSQLTGEHITDADYEHAVNVFNTFQLQNLGDYHDLYLKSDVLLLADVFENFRNICLNYYELDPAHFYTSPGLAWSACLKMTDIELELLTDPDMYLFIEEGTRGGISMISNRYSKANNPYVDDYDPSQDKTYVMYLDANNLYGWAMSQPLPTHDFAWLSDEEVQDFDVMQAPDDDEDGFILEVDLEYPEDLHDSHSDYPLAPEKMKVTTSMLSPYCQQLHEEFGGTLVPKLVPNLLHKKNYIVHYRNLKLYLEQGMKLTKIHRILTFAQSSWLKRYINFNTEKRKQATNDFEKDFFKLMNNAVFGKTMENLRKRVNVKLIKTESKLLKLSASPAFDSFKIFSENLAAVNMKKTELYLNRPIYVGFTILDLSKVLMYNFHYNHMISKYGSNCKLLFTDTDSLCYAVKTEDIYRDMESDLDLFDTSDYERQHFLYSTHNKKVLGKMKDETHGVAVVEFIGLRPKMYSLKYKEDGKEIEKKTAKGISRNITERNIRHTHYRECLFERKRTINEMKQIQSKNHQLYTIRVNKIGLSPYDDKRYITDDGIETLAYGHYKIGTL